jgi:transposase InsO family protein
MHADFCVEALKEAIDRFGPPEIMNTDQGSQFTGSAWVTTLSVAGVRISMDGRPFPRQHLHRASVAVTEAGGSLSRRVDRRLPGAQGYPQLDDLLQHRVAPFPP